MTGSDYTIETLKSKRVAELRVIFKVASEVSANARCHRRNAGARPAPACRSGAC